MTHFYRIKHAKIWRCWGHEHHPRFGHPCRVLCRGRNGNVLVEFSDGGRMVTCRWGIRRRVA